MLTRICWKFQFQPGTETTTRSSIAVLRIWSPYSLNGHDTVVNRDEVEILSSTLWYYLPQPPFASVYRTISAHVRTKVILVLCEQGNARFHLCF